MYQYPYGNAQQLNLDWILNKLKELELGSGATLEEVSNALIALNYAEQNYNLSDIVFHNGKLYSANQNITAEPWNPEHWNEVLLANPVSNLVRYVSALNNSQVYNSSNVAGTHTSDALNNLSSAISEVFNAGAITQSDCNDFVKGLFKFSPTTLNIPDPPYYGFVIGYVAQDNLWKWQIAITTHSTPKVYVRNNINDGGWSVWKRIATEEDIDTLNGAINDTIIRAPNYYGATDIDSIVAYCLSVRSGDISKYSSRLFWFLANYSSGATGYFGTSSFCVICCFTSDNYGYGIMFSDAAKSFASFRKSSSTVELYPIGDFKSNINQLFGDIANVQSGSTASRTFDKGERVIVNGQLYKVTQKILSGGTFNVGTNITGTNVSAMGLASAYFTCTLNTSYISSGNVYGVKVGRIANALGWIVLSKVPNKDEVLVSGLPRAQRNVTIPMYDQSLNTWCAGYIKEGTGDLIANYSLAGRTGSILNITSAYITTLDEAV